MRAIIGSQTNSSAKKITILLTLVLSLHSPFTMAQPDAPLSVQALVRMKADQPETLQHFTGIATATRSWRLCVVLPNVSDTFWDEVVSGVREESTRLGVTSVIYEASGYTDSGLLQQERILNQRCSAQNLDAVLLAAVDRTGLNTSLRRLRANKVLVIDFVNGYDPQEVDARAFLDNYHLGNATGIDVKKYLAAHPTAKTPNILWVPGPEHADWAKRGDEGFRAALKGMDLNIETLHLNPHQREQNLALRRHMQTGKSYDLIVGTGPTSVAVFQLKVEGIIHHDTPIFAYYATPDVLKLLEDGQVISSVSNEPRLQGRMGVALAIGMLEKLPMPFQAGPAPRLLHPKAQATSAD